MGKNISLPKFLVRLWLLSQLGPSRSIRKATGNGLSLRPYIFHAHALYREVLISLQSSSLGLVISRKNTKVKSSLLRKNLREDGSPGHFRLKFLQSVSVKTSYLISINAFFLLLSYDLEPLKLIVTEKTCR